jgi:hypothetical protein
MKKITARGEGQSSSAASRQPAAQARKSATLTRPLPPARRAATTLLAQRPFPGTMLD